MTRQDQTLLKCLLFAIVAFHVAVIFVNVTAFFVLPFTAWILDLPFWFTVFLITPIESIILVLSFAREPCPLTRAENKVRERLGMKPIGGFIGYYFIRQKWRRKKLPIEINTLQRRA